MSSFNKNLLYAKVLSEPENKVCFDCNSIDEDELPWTSASHGVFICHRCTVIHLTLSLSPGSTFGSYPKIFLIDLWTPEELRKLSLGGNKRARIFFEQHGWTGGTNIEEKHTSRAAKLYRQLLSEDAEFTIAKEKGLLPATFDDDINANEALNDGFAEKDNDNGTSIKKLVDAYTGGPGVPKLTQEVPYENVEDYQNKVASYVSNFGGCVRRILSG